MGRAKWAASIVAAALLWVGCGQDGAETVHVRLATTTSTDNSGLLDVLLPPFEKAAGIRVDVIAVGTGKAITLAQNGDVDVILVHDRAREEKFVADGFGVARHAVMHNDFVVLGPAADPAKVKGMADVAQAMKAIAEARAPFASRGDDSGTHAKEKALWAAAGIQPAGAWYLEVGQGMGATLTVASEKQAYVLADRGTFLAYRGKVELVVLCQGDQRLSNPYGIIAVNPARHPHTKHEAARKLIDFVVSVEGQKLIAGFRKGGQPLFFPDALPKDD